MSVKMDPIVVVVVFALILAASVEAKYYGTFLGAFQDSIHGVKGEVFAVDSRTLFIKGFSYDGLGPDAYFYGGDQLPPNGKGFHIPDDKVRTLPDAGPGPIQSAGRDFATLTGSFILHRRAPPTS